MALEVSGPKWIRKSGSYVLSSKLFLKCFSSRKHELEVAIKKNNSNSDGP